MIYTFVTPENRDKHRDIMKQYFQKMALVWDAISLDDYDTQNARYVVCNHAKYGVIGGVRLLPTMGPKLSDDSLGESGIVLQDVNTWEASKLFFCVVSPEKGIEDSSEYEDLCEKFYQGLWEYIRSICNIEMLVTLLPEEEHQDVSHFGNWPFVLESPVGNPFEEEGDEYVLGVLKISEQEELPLAS